MGRLSSILFLVIVQSLILMKANFPVNFDLESTAYLYGMFHQGILIPIWFMGMYPECSSFVKRDVLRNWPFMSFSRLQQSQLSRA